MIGWAVAILVVVSMFVGVCLWELTKWVITGHRGKVARDIADLFNSEDERVRR